MGHAGQSWHPGFDACSNDKLWTQREVELIINPPPLPKPPSISGKDVITPPAGSAERPGADDMPVQDEQYFGLLEP